MVNKKPLSLNRTVFDIGKIKTNKNSPGLSCFLKWIAAIENERLDEIIQLWIPFRFDYRSLRCVFDGSQYGIILVNGIELCGRSFVTAGIFYVEKEYIISKTFPPITKRQIYENSNL